MELTTAILIPRHGKGVSKEGEKVTEYHEKKYYEKKKGTTSHWGTMLELGFKDLGSTPYYTNYSFKVCTWY